MLANIDDYLEENEDGVLVSPMTDKPLTKWAYGLKDQIINNDLVMSSSPTEAQLVHLVFSYDASMRGAKINLVGLLKEFGITATSHAQLRKVIAETEALNGKSGSSMMLDSSDFEVLEVER